jgi:hypothetical protein
MAEGEGAQERPQHGGGHHPMGKHRLGGTGSQHVGMVDVAGSGHHGVHQGQHFAPGKCSTDTTRQVDNAVDQLLET